MQQQRLHELRKNGYQRVCRRQRLPSRSVMQRRGVVRATQQGLPCGHAVSLSSHCAAKRLCGGLPDTSNRRHAGMRSPGTAAACRCWLLPSAACKSHTTVVMLAASMLASVAPAWPCRRQPADHRHRTARPAPRRRRLTHHTPAAPCMCGGAWDQHLQHTKCRQASAWRVLLWHCFYELLDCSLDGMAVYRLQMSAGNPI